MGGGGGGGNKIEKRAAGHTSSSQGKDNKDMKSQNGFIQGDKKNNEVENKSI